MFNISLQNFFKLTFFITSLLLISVYVMQYGFNILPCKLCIFQRFPYFAIIALLGLYFVVGSKYNPKTILILVTLIFIISTGLSLYHSLIEFKIITTDLQCAQLEDFKTKASIYNDLIGKKAVSCDMATFKIFNFSLSNWNFLVSFIMLFISIILIYKNK
jgi:disulfide bond formation protein DsbB